MTNDELKALCLQVECSSFERDVAESILRLLDQCDAMRGVVDAGRILRDSIVKVMDFADGTRVGNAIDGFDKALSQLGERT